MVLPAAGTSLAMQERCRSDAGRRRNSRQGQRLRRLPDRSACRRWRTAGHPISRSFPAMRSSAGSNLVGAGVTTHRVGERVGIPWLGYTCGVCRYCRSGMENLCDRPLFTGYTRDGGFATHLARTPAIAFRSATDGDDVAIAPLLVRRPDRLALAGDGGRGRAARHLWLRCGRAHRRPGRALAGPFGLCLHARRRRRGAGLCATSLGADWAGGSRRAAGAPLDAAIIYAPVGELVPLALRAVRKGGRVVCAGIHMSDIPSFPYHLLWEERQLVSVANLTRQDGIEFLKIAPQAGIRTAYDGVSRCARPTRSCRSCAPDRSSGAAVLQPMT